MTTSPRAFPIRIAGALRTAWMVAGVTLLLLLCIEVGFRIKNAITRSRQKPAERTATLAGDPYKDAWYADFMEEYDATRPQRWRPYVQFGRVPDYHGRYVDIDAYGRRTVPQPSSPALPAATVYMFGGSTMWGDSQRGEHTIAGETARRLQSIAPAGARISVTNFGESGYVSTQELIQLETQLQAGFRPDVVLFYDGLNDVASTVQSGTPGLPQNETKRVSEFAMGRALDRTGFARGLKKDLTALAILSFQGLRQLELTDWLLSHKKAPNVDYIAADSAARATVRAYRNNMEIVEALSKQFGFRAVYIWQPNLHASTKKPNAFEQRLLARIDRDPFHHRLQETHRLVPPLLDSAMNGVAPGRFINAAGLFAGDTLAVYTDWLGHNTEVSVPHIVDTFWSDLAREVSAALSARGLVPAATASGQP